MRFVPILLGTDRYADLESLGKANCEGDRRSSSSRFFIIASSDMNHYENDVVTRGKQLAAIDRFWRSTRAASTTRCARKASPCAATPQR